MSRPPDPGSVAALLEGCLCPVPEPGTLLVGFDQDGVACRAFEVHLGCSLHPVRTPAETDTEP